MSQQKRQAVLVGIMLVLLAAAAVWSYGWMRDQRQGARLAREELIECRRLVREIEALKAKPAMASAEAMGIQKLGRRIESASRQANFEGAPLEGVFPQSARRVADSPYLRKPTALALRGVTFRQFVTFVYHLTDQSGLSVRDLRLRTPHGDGPRHLWDAEATVTYLIYEPPSQAP